MALAMIAAFVLAIGGVRLAMRKDDRKRGILMLVAAAVLVGNVLILTI
jgi:high-affinity Fe2+/Pb2+ permease